MFRAALTLLSILPIFRLTDLAGPQLARRRIGRHDASPAAEPRRPALLVNPLTCPPCNAFYSTSIRQSTRRSFCATDRPLAAQPVALSALGTQNAEGAVAVLVPALPSGSMGASRRRLHLQRLRAARGIASRRAIRRPYLLEETYEVLDAPTAAAALREELVTRCSRSCCTARSR